MLWEGVREMRSERERVVTSARDYSRRHKCMVWVEHVIKGRGKARYGWHLKGHSYGWGKGSKVEVIAMYCNGKPYLTCHWRYESVIRRVVK